VFQLRSICRNAMQSGHHEQALQARIGCNRGDAGNINLWWSDKYFDWNCRHRWVCPVWLCMRKRCGGH
jgi:hypothetical protein